MAVNRNYVKKTRLLIAFGIEYQSTSFTHFKSCQSIFGGKLSFGARLQGRMPPKNIDQSFTGIRFHPT